MNFWKILKDFSASGDSFRCILLSRGSSRDSSRPVALRPKKSKSEGAVSQYFVDHRIVETIGGKGGDGCISFLRLKENPNAGPDGGDGGNGGHVLFKATRNVADLNCLRKVIKAPDGERGFNRDCGGKNGRHEYAKVPVGTVVRNSRGMIVGDLSEEGAVFIAARGGAGGRGNHYFASDTVQAPRVAEFGARGETCKYVLEVKSMAHVGLVGVPNAGKSTLLRAISRARPEVAAHAFTTLKPHVGIVQYSDYEQVAVADLPGLVEGSHKNLGLGIEFLRHVERCRGLLFLLDLSRDDPLEQYEILRHEISNFSGKLNSRPFVVVANKLDLTEAQVVIFLVEIIEEMLKKNFKSLQSKMDCSVIGISGKTGKNLTELLEKIREMYDVGLKNSKD